MRRFVTLLLLGCSLPAGAAVQMTLDPRSLNEAIAIGQSRLDRDRTRFHEPYRLIVNRAPLDYVEVVTPFREIVLVAQSRAEIGDRSFGQRQAVEMSSGAPEVEFWLELTFHPLNTYVGVPGYEVSLAERTGRRIAPQGIERLPRHGPRVQGMPLPLPVPGGLQLPETTQPLTGGTVIARFDGRALNPSGVYELVVEETRKEVTRVRVDFGGLR
jgi:hypothetical protein